MKTHRPGMRKTSWALLTVLLVFSGGCEWEGSGDGDFWSERYEFLNFSGVYNPARGSSIILSYESEGDVDAGAGTGTIDNQKIGVGDGSRTTFSGILPSRPVVPGSLSVTAGGFQLNDSGGGSLIGANVSGTINYGTGAWSIDLGGTPLVDQSPITATYRYEIPHGGGSTQPGSTHPIYQFTVQQTGNQITLIDNYGQTYKGKLAAVDTTAQSQVVGDQQTISERFSFTVEGNAHGMRVRIVGAFRAHQTVYYSRAREFDESGRMSSDRLDEVYRIASFFMEGTWIEPSGKTGRIDAMGPANQRIEIIAQ